MKKNLLGILFLFWVCMAWAGELKLWYSKPAKDWTEALPWVIPDWELWCMAARDAKNCS